jgi:hypothetical protein
MVKIDGKIVFSVFLQKKLYFFAFKVFFLNLFYYFCK